MIRIAQVDRPDRDEARQLLAVLHDRYPGGLDWLERRLDDVDAGRAWAWRAGNGGAALGYAIATPKGLRREKLSTLYVAAHARGQGIGRSLLAALFEDWRRRELDEVFVTVDEADSATKAFLVSHGFSHLPHAGRAYGERSDAIYVLSPRKAPYWPSRPSSGASQLNSAFITCSTS